MLCVGSNWIEVVGVALVEVIGVEIDFGLDVGVEVIGVEDSLVDLGISILTSPPPLPGA